MLFVEGAAGAILGSAAGVSLLGMVKLGFNLIFLGCSLMAGGPSGRELPAAVADASCARFLRSASIAACRTGSTLDFSSSWADLDLPAASPFPEAPPSFAFCSC